MARDGADRGHGPTIPLLVAIVVTALDQGTKVLVVGALGPGQPRHRSEVVPGLIDLHYVENRGAAFGILRGAGDLLAFLALAVLVFLVVAYRRIASSSPLGAVGIGLIGGGAIGNLLDRLRLGYVVDFVAIGPWPNFNLADSAITVGVLLLAGAMLVAGPGPDLPAPVGDPVTPANQTRAVDG